MTRFPQTSYREYEDDIAYAENFDIGELSKTKFCEKQGNTPPTKWMTLKSSPNSNTMAEKRI